MDNSWHSVIGVHSIIDRMIGAPLHPAAPIGPVTSRNAPGYRASQKYCVKREYIIERGREIPVVGLRLLDRGLQGRRLASRVKTGQQRERHPAPNVHADLIEKSWVEVNYRPLPVEPYEFDLEDSEVTEFSTKAANPI
jgi:hypothetical protein